MLNRFSLEGHASVYLLIFSKIHRPCFSVMLSKRYSHHIYSFSENILNQKGKFVAPCLYIESDLFFERL